MMFKASHNLWIINLTLVALSVHCIYEWNYTMANKTTITAKKTGWLLEPYEIKLHTQVFFLFKSLPWCLSYHIILLLSCRYVSSNFRGLMLASGYKWYWLVEQYFPS